MPRSGLGVRAQAALEAIDDLLEQPLPVRDLLDEVDERVRRIVPADCASWWRSDPESLLPSELVSFDIDDLRDEVIDDEYALLDRAGGSVAVLSSRSVRGCDGGLDGGDRLRILARSGGSSWGMACSTRAPDLPAYTEAEKRFMGAVAMHVGDALRASLARSSFDAPDTTAGVGAGTLVLDTDHRPDGATRDALYWLQRLGVDAGVSLPPSMRWVAFQAHARERLAEAGRVVRPARARMPLADGTWLLVEADPLTGTAEGRTALTLRPAGRAELLPLQLALHGLTPREAQVAEGLVDGRTSTEIASSLGVSRHTVRDHTKAAYAKAGVHSRAELTALLTAGARAATTGTPTPRPLGRASADGAHRHRRPGTGAGASEPPPAVAAVPRSSGSV